MTTYPKYKDSCTPWLGQIPEHWETDKVSQLFAERREKCSDTEFQPLSVSKQGVTPQLDTAVKTDNGDNRKKVCIGDFVVNSRSDRKGSCGVSPLDGSVSLINTVLESRGKLIRPYIHYLLRSHYYIEEYYRWGRGIVADLWTTRYSEMKNIMLPLPPRAEQERIVEFIDSKTKKIDAYVVERERELKLLAELKQSEIAAAVTRGLNPYVPLKDSGIAWIGQIPEHWEVKRIANVIFLVKDGKGKASKKIGLENVESWTGSYISTATIYDGIGTDFKKNDILFGKLRPYLAKVYLADFEGQAVGDFLVFRTKENILPKYAQYYLLNPQVIGLINSFTYGAKMPRANWLDISKVYIPLPPLAEQHAIVEYIDRKCSNINSLISELEAEIAYLKEYKQRLIADAVTGAIMIE